MSDNVENKPKHNNKPEHYKKHKKGKKKPILITICILAFLIVGLAVGGVSYAYGLFNKMDRVEIDENNLGIDKSIDKKLSQYNGIMNIALFGVDATNGNYGRSDSIMILTVDTNRNKIKVSSLIRDCYVPIEHHGKTELTKLNHAYAFGQAPLALKTINQNFDLNLKDFASINFSNLPILIDKVEGIDLTITPDELKYINDYIDNLNQINKTNVPHITEPGVQHVNGTQALAYCRIRYTKGGDPERTHRHRIVLTALFEKFKQTPVTKLPGLLNELLPLVKTNLQSNEILGLAVDVAKMGNITLEQARFPEDNYSESAMINKIYYLKFDKAKTVQQLHDFIFEDKKD